MSLWLYIETAEKVSHSCECPSCGNQHDSPPLAGSQFSENITHNLGGMFREAGLYEILWRGTGMPVVDVLPRLEAGLDLMIADPPRFEKFNAANGWGMYPHALEFLRHVISACKENPEGVIRCSV